MDSLQFCYWLKGYFEISGAEVGLTDVQVDIIKDHLDLVFQKVTPVRSAVDTKVKEIEKRIKSIYDEINPCNTFVSPPPDPNVRTYYAGNLLCYSPDLIKYNCHGSC